MQQHTMQRHTMQQHTIQQHTMQRDTIQFRYNAVQRDGSGWQSGGPGAVGGHACDAIRGHRTASLLYFVFCIYVKFRKKHVHTQIGSLAEQIAATKTK